MGRGLRLESPSRDIGRPIVGRDEAVGTLAELRMAMLAVCRQETRWIVMSWHPSVPVGGTVQLIA